MKLSLGEKLQLARESAKLSRCDLAAKAGIHRATLSDMETGKRSTRIGTIEKVIEALGLDGIEDLNRF